MVIIMAKDKIIGFIVMILGILIAIVYTMGSVVDLWFSTWGGDPLWAHKVFGELIGSILSWELFVVLPLWLIVILISIIAIWIGYSMLTTPAPVPLEELEEELAAEEEGEESS
jgi:predicted membrane protein